MPCSLTFMRKIEVTTAFKRDFKREAKGPHRSILDTELKQIISLLAGDMPLPQNTATMRSQATGRITETAM